MKLENQIVQEWMTRNQAAGFLGISVRSLDSLKAARRIPFVRLNSMVRFSRIELERYLRDHCTVKAVGQ